MSDRPNGKGQTKLRVLALGGVIILLLAALITIFFNRLAARDLILARGDTLLYFYPYWQAAADALRVGRIPLWNPNLFMGAPFLANSQVGFFYPLNWPLWLLMETPYAVTFSIMLHLLIAAGGAYLMARRCLSLTRAASFLAAVLFALGGYLTAQVEHVNQVQGIAWLPWYFVVLCPWRPRESTRHQAIKVGVSIAAVLSLQILSGHTQTVFISMTAVAIWLGATLWTHREPAQPERTKQERAVRMLGVSLVFVLPVAAGILLAISMTAIQLLPTLELSRNSLRQGGLPPNEVLSFSLQPLLLGQSLLPAYDNLVFSEYVVFVPIAALLLAAIGFRQLWKERSGVGLIVLAIAGLFLALGRHNPIYYLLTVLPGFNLFRAPARWSILYALVIALAAASGWQAVLRTARTGGLNGERRKDIRALAAGAMIILLLVAWSILAVKLATILPVAPEVTIEKPSIITVAAWLIETALATVLILLILRRRLPVPVSWFVLFVAIGVLFISTRVLAYNHPTAADAYFENRAPISRLLAVNECKSSVDPCIVTGDRVLGLSDIFFDLGDQAEIDSVYAGVLGQTEMFDYVVANKQKEILGPNLPLAFGLQSVDGFDGGVLPLEKYATLMRLILPEGKATSDGRLREYLDRIPEERWLDLFGAKYIITDRVGDQWRREVFFDMKHPVTIDETTGGVEIGYIPDFEATELWVMGTGTPGDVTIITESADTWEIIPMPFDSNLWRVAFPHPVVPDQILLNHNHDGCDDSGCKADWNVQALATVDARDGTFTPLIAGNYRPIYSGDVKIYENLDVMPRASLLFDWRLVEDDQQALRLMEDESFDPSRTAVISGVGLTPDGTGNGNGAGSGYVTLQEYLPERIVLQSSSDAQTLLLLTEADYPGWQVTIDGDPAEILESDILFRGVIVPEGLHTVVFEYLPESIWFGRLISLLGFTIWLILVVYVYVWPFVRRRSSVK